MTLLVVLILAVIWAAVLLPPWIQNRSESRPADSISNFRNQLSVLERRASAVWPDAYRSSPTAVRGPATVTRARQLDRARLARMEAKKRRRDVLLTLLAASGLTLLLSFLSPRVFLLHLFIDALLAVYVALLVRARKLAEERAAKVRYLAQVRPVTIRYATPEYVHAHRAAVQPQFALRRTAGG